MATTIPESDTQALVEELRRQVEGEVRFDKMTRVLYSTDASIYQIEPIGVIIPRTAEDVIAVIETANRHGVPVLPRGGGTSLAGQAVGHAIVIDFSKYMRDVIEVNADEGWVRTQPGIILDELNHYLAPHGMLFAPDPSTSNRGNVGGALGNNSCGAHSIVWGKTVDTVLELAVVLSNGDTATFGPLDGEQLEVKIRREGLEGEIYRKLLAIGGANRDEILARYPKIQRRVGGYNLDEFVSGGDFDMARFVVGSEGTLVAITEARLRIVPRPLKRALAVLHFGDLLESMEATVATLEMDPAAVELIGSMIIRQARSNLEYSRSVDFIEGDPDALLAVEFVGESEAELESKLDTLEQRMKRSGLGYAVRRLVKPEDQARVWAFRRAGLGLMMNVPGDAKPLPFVEDAAVAPEHLPEFVKRFDQIVRHHGTVAGVLRPRQCRVLAHSPADRRQGPGGRGPHGVHSHAGKRPGPGVRRRHERRARRWSRAKRMEREDVRAPAIQRLPRGQASLRPQWHHEPGKDRGLAAHDRESAHQPGLPHAGAQDGLRLLAGG